MYQYDNRYWERNKIHSLSLYLGNIQKNDAKIQS